MSASVSGKMGATGRTVGSGVERSSAPGHGAALLRGWAGGAGAARGGSMDSVQGAEACRCAPAGAFGYKVALSAGAREGCLGFAGSPSMTKTVAVVRDVCRGRLL